MVNPEWGYWWRFWSRQRPVAWWFRLFNELAWSTEVIAALSMLVPATRSIGGMLILVTFVFIATQIRLGFLCEMVMVCCVLFAHPGSLVDVWLSAVVAPPEIAATNTAPAWVNALLAAGLWMYLVALPLVHAGLSFNLYAKKRFPGMLQRTFDAYANTFGIIVWRVFSADHTNFLIEIDERKADGTTQRISTWGEGLRFSHVAESITVTTLFTTLKILPEQQHPVHHTAAAIRAHDSSSRKQYARISVFRRGQARGSIRLRAGGRVHRGSGQGCRRGACHRPVHIRAGAGRCVASS